MTHIKSLKSKFYLFAAGCLSLVVAAPQTAQSLAVDVDDSDARVKQRANELKVAFAGKHGVVPKVLPKSPVQKAYHGGRHCCAAMGVRG